MYQERLMCFTESDEITISEHSRNTDRHSNLPYNGSVMYPSLYPQMENKNINSNINRRSNVQEVWHIKM